MQVQRTALVAPAGELATRTTGIASGATGTGSAIHRAGEAPGTRSGRSCRTSCRTDRLPMRGRARVGTSDRPAVCRVLRQQCNFPVRTGSADGFCSRLLLVAVGSTREPLARHAQNRFLVGQGVESRRRDPREGMRFVADREPVVLGANEEAYVKAPLSPIGRPSGVSRTTGPVAHPEPGRRYSRVGSNRDAFGSVRLAHAARRNVHIGNGGT